MNFFTLGTLMIPRTLFVVTLVCVFFLPRTSLAQEKAKIKQGVEKAINHLKESQQPDGTWKHQDIGATALATLTLLSCDVPKDDPAIQKAVRAVRSKIPGMTHTYSISLSLMVLDRLDESGDAPLIEALGLRLLRGQNSFGGWGYHCPTPTANEVKRLTKLVEEANKKKNGKDQKPKLDKEWPAQRVLSKETVAELTKVRVRPLHEGGMGDNSNTAIASMAVWNLGRHGFREDWVFERLEKRFSQTQQQAGGWGYLPLSPQVASVSVYNVSGGVPAQIPKGVVNNDLQPIQQKPRPNSVAEVIHSYATNPTCTVIAFAYGKNIREFPKGWWNHLGVPLLGVNLELFKPPYQRNYNHALWIIAVRKDHLTAAKGAKAVGVPLQQLQPVGVTVVAPSLSTIVLSQAETGTLAPSLRVTSATPQMTAAGLSCLTISHALRKDPRFTPTANQELLDQARELALARALLRLGDVVEQPHEDASKVPTLGPRSNGYFTLWSLQRVATTFGLEKLGGKDWHAWGSQLLLANQQEDGSFRGAFGQGGADTCFALLFLTKADLTPTLTWLLKGEGASLSALAERKPEAPAANPEEQELKRMAEVLVKAPPQQQDVLLAQLRDNAAPLASGVLVEALPRLPMAQQVKARHCLLQRTIKLPAEGVRALLEEENVEWRRAAALACGWQKQVAHVPALIPLLADEEPAVAQAAQQSLRALTGQNFGPAANATEAERKKATAAWRAWWQKYSGKQAGS